MGEAQEAGVRAPSEDDGVVIDITDAALARWEASQEGARTALAADEVVIDLRDHIVAAGEAGLVTDLRTWIPAAPAIVAPSGRPQELLPHHRLEMITGGDMWMAAEAFVYDTYVKIGYTAPNTRHQVEELARWADRSRFYAVIDDSDKIVGTVRTIFGPYEELPVSQFERTDAGDPDPVCELSSLVVDPHERSTGVIEHLYRAGWLDAWRARSNAVVALIDDWLLEVFQRRYHLPFRPIGVAKEYMGTVPVPVALPLDAHHYVPMSQTNPYFWAWTLEAIDLHEIAAWGLPITIVDDEGARRYGMNEASPAGTPSAST